MSGCFISIEGVDGSGKSTQVLMLEKFLKGKELDVVVTQEPGGTVIGEKIRKIILDKKHEGMSALTELLLYASARVQHIAEVILPALNENRIVICSRFSDSTYAYQGYGAGIDLEILKEVNALATGNLQPDLTILFDLAPERGLHRVEGRLETDDKTAEEKDRMESKNIEFHQRVRDGFMALAYENPERIKVIDASGKQEDVFLEVTAVVEKYLNGRQCGRNIL